MKDLTRFGGSSGKSKPPKLTDSERNLRDKAKSKPFRNPKNT